MLYTTSLLLCFNPPPPPPILQLSKGQFKHFFVSNFRIGHKYFFQKPCGTGTSVWIGIGEGFKGWGWGLRVQCVLRRKIRISSRN